MYYSLIQNKIQKSKSIAKVCIDYGLELQSKKADKWFSHEDITFESSAPYLQKQNGVSKRMRRTILDMA